MSPPKEAAIGGGSEALVPRNSLFANKLETLDKKRPPFSEQAAEAWATRVAEFEFDLGELSMLQASQEGDNVVSDHHVQRSALFLVTTRKDKLAIAAKDLGGITMGMGGGALIAFASSGIVGAWLWIAIALTIVGTGMFFRFSR
jgi:hypothetical protein